MAHAWECDLNFAQPGCRRSRIACRVWLWTLGFWLLFISESKGSFSDEVRYMSYQDTILFQGPFRTYIDKGSRLSVEEVSKVEFTYGTHAISSSRSGLILDRVWIKGVIVNRADTGLTVLINFTETDDVSLYLAEKNGYRLVSRAGYGVPIARNWPAKEPCPFLVMHIGPADTLDVLIKATINDSYLVQEMQIFSPDGSDKNISEARLFYRNVYLQRYFFLGVFIFQMTYILVQFIIKRRKEYAWYFMYLVCVVLFYAIRLEIQYWDYIVFGYVLNHAVSVLNAVNFACFLFYFGFGRYFLDLKTRLPYLNKKVIVLEVFLALLVLAVFLAPYVHVNLNHQLILWVGGTSIFLISVWFILSAVRLKNASVYYFLAGSLLYSISNLSAFLIRNLGLMEISSDFDTIVFIEAGMVAELLLFTTGLAHKEVQTERQKTVAEQQLIAEKQTREMEKRMALQTERERISRELHDDLGAQLSTARMFLNNLKTRESASDPSLVEHSLKLIENSISDLRIIMNDLHESALQENGYILATEGLINKLNCLNKIRFNLVCHGINGRFNPETEHHLFRITQELINNTLKYAEANSVSLELIGRDNQYIFMYEDNGVGFDQTVVANGYGLENISKRARSMNANFSFDSSPGRGFRFILEIPQVAV